jgi:hypothetical protein
MTLRENRPKGKEFGGAGVEQLECGGGQDCIRRQLFVDGHERMESKRAGSVLFVEGAVRKDRERRFVPGQIWALREQLFGHG